MLSSLNKNDTRYVAVIDSDSERSASTRACLHNHGYATMYSATLPPFTERWAKRPDCFLIELGLFRLAPELLDDLALRHLGTPIVYIDSALRSREVTAAIKSGAFDVVQWPNDCAELARCIDEAIAEHVKRTTLQYRLESVLGKTRDLTRRERQVMELVAKGNANKVVSFDLNISERTVEVHRANAMRKVGATSLPELVLIDLLARCFEESEAWTSEWWDRGVRLLLDRVPVEDDYPAQRVA